MSTTNLIENGYVMGASNTAWQLRGWYSTAINLASDHCGGVDYDFIYSQFSISSMGAEASTGDYVIKAIDSDIIIDHFKMDNNHKNKAYIMNDTRSTIVIDSLSISDTQPEIAPDYLFDFGYATNSITQVKHLKQIPPDVEKILLDTGRTRDTPIIFLEGVYYKPSHNSEGEQFYQEYLLLDDEHGHKTVAFSDTTPEDINGYNFNWYSADPKGTIHLRKQLDNGQFAYIRSDDNVDAQFRNASYKVIPYINAGSTEDRPTDGLIKGQMFFDETLGKPIWWFGTAWVDATGETV